MATNVPHPTQHPGKPAPQKQTQPPKPAPPAPKPVKK